jgi:1-aminocyclopropane-1-carboxylate deaminase
MVFEVFNQEITGFRNNISLFIKREDLIHPFISGNKYRKLKHNLLQAKKEELPTLLTFGGAFSNHIAAVAFAGRESGFNTIGVIRGEELETKIDENPTLLFAQQNGMQFYFETRNNYRNKDSHNYKDNLKALFGDFYLIPEGGTNELAVKGCKEILTAEDNVFDYICCSVGTGGTISGILNSISENQKVIGFPALNGDFLKEDIRKFTNAKNWVLKDEYTFGGYAKTSNELIEFINSFYNRTKIPLDPVYTGKMLFGIEDLIHKKYFPNGSKILAIHTGGLQGIKGMNIKLENKKLQKIIIDV